jgi:Phytanoyl-CoA dioxygenase (PhyH)
MGNDLDDRLNHLSQYGYVIIERALSPSEYHTFADRIKALYHTGHDYGANDVGTIWFDDILSVDPDLFGSLIAHRSVRQELQALAGSQLQLRSLRGHYYPGQYRQHWHMDFYGYWDQRDQGQLAAQGLALNTTFYFQDGGPDSSQLEFVTGGHLERPAGVKRGAVIGTEQNEFTQWCESQPRTVIYPRAGDCVLFYSHIPHRGVKTDPFSERSNIVCHYQVNPFYPGVWFLSETIGDSGIYPFAEAR